MVDTPESFRDLPRAILGNMITLAASGFGVVVALAWNSLIQRVVSQYLDPLIGKDGGLLSMLIYAVAITVVAVLVTMQLTTLQRKLDRSDKPSNS